jgi:signal transduction histidine kinase
MLQVLANLVGNAIKFSSPPAEIILRARRVDATVGISVTDKGVGIIPERLEVVFERFWQATKGHRAGLGLGLYISRWIVDAHGGKIWATSVPRQGSTFSFTLPLA